MLGFGPWDEDAAIDVEGAAEELALADEVGHRLAARAAGDQDPKALLDLRLDRPLVGGEQRRFGEAGQQGEQPRRFPPGRVDPPSGERAAPHLHQVAEGAHGGDPSAGPLDPRSARFIPQFVMIVRNVTSNIDESSEFSEDCVAMDARDTQILSILQRDARTSNAEIGRELGIAPSGVLERLRKLERRGVLRGYTARIDPEAVGVGLLAYVFVQADDRAGEENSGAQLARLAEVQEVHHIAGEDCYLVKVRCGSTAALGRLLQEKFGAIPSVRRTRTTIVLGTLKESWELPLPELDREVEHDGAA